MFDSLGKAMGLFFSIVLLIGILIGLMLTYSYDTYILKHDPLYYKQLNLCLDTATRNEECVVSNYTFIKKQKD